MNVLLIVGEDLKAPSSLVGLLTTSLQPVEIDEVLDGEDLEELTKYIDSLNAEHVYVLFGTSSEEYQSLKAIKESTIKVDAFFSCF